MEFLAVQLHSHPLIYLVENSYFFNNTKFKTTSALKYKSWTKISNTSLLFKNLLAQKKEF